MHSLDLVNYARWMSAFLDDMKALPSKNKAVYDEFYKGFLHSCKMIRIKLSSSLIS